MAGAAVILWWQEHNLLPLVSLANAAGVHPDLVACFTDYGLLEPASGSGGDALYPPSAVDDLKCICRLRHDLGVNLAGVAAILELRRQVALLQSELAAVRRSAGNHGASCAPC